jgi:hypothetical protein
VGVGSASHGARRAPLVVDLEPERRTDLEVALRRGVAVVRADCRTLEVLPRCRAHGAYAYAGTAPKEQLVRMHDAESLRATLPLTGPQLVAKIGAELAQGTSLDLALLMVGKLTATRPVMSSDELIGDCAGASHFIQSATLGAFALKTGVASRNETAVSVFSAELAGGHQHSHQIATRDGDVARCNIATSTDATAPEGCNAVLRLELLPLREPLPAVSAVSKATEADFLGRFCPDIAACEARCDAGEALCCFQLGVVHNIGDRVPRNLGRATRAFQRACELDEPTSCTLLGIALISRGPRADVAHGREMLERACERSQAQACAGLGFSYRNSSDEERASYYLKRACDYGDRSACAAR